MTAQNSGSRQRIGFLLIEGFALMSCAAAVEPLRAANLLAKSELYELVFLSREGGPVRASCGAMFDAIAVRGISERPDMVFVVAGGDPFAIEDPTLFAQLRRLANHGVKMGGISGGAVVLAKAGLLENRRFTVHWEHFDALQEQSDAYLMERKLFVIDRDRATCAGGAAPLDMMHAMIRGQHGADLARGVSDWFIQTGVRSAEDPQREGAAKARPDLHRLTATALDLIETHLADPLSLPQIARLAGASERQLQRQFSRDMGDSVMRHYHRLRLRKADELLEKTRLPVTEIALATGFASAAHFSTSYRAEYGISPSARRQAG